MIGLITSAIVLLLAGLVIGTDRGRTSSPKLANSWHQLEHIEPPEGFEWMADDDDEEQKNVDDSPVDAFWEWARTVARDEDEAEAARYQRRIGAEEADRRRRRTSAPLHPPNPRPNPRPRNIRPDAPPCLLRDPPDRPFREHRSHPRPWEAPDFDAAALPRRWDWRAVDGTNYCSSNRNQHIPVYCGACWCFGTLASVQDRFNVVRKARWPLIQLSPQEIIACNGQGSCNGGTAQNVMEHAKIRGLVEEGCNNYKAVNEKCTPFTRCGSCWPDYCFAIQNYTRYYIGDYGKVSGREAMMAEIRARGPIACAISATETFDKEYFGGIFQELADAPSNHIVSVSGWGWDEESKTEYWIVRNSWGDAWGELGWFRIVTSLYRGGRGDQYNLGIERDCYFADPDISNLPPEWIS